MQIWAYFSGQVGCKLNWPLPHRKSAVIFREYFALNPCSLYPGSCSFGLWLPSTPQFGEFRISLLIATFVLLSMLSFFELCLFCILRHLNDNRPTSHKGEVLEDWGLDGINVPFSICHPPTGLVYPHRPLLCTPGALTVTPKVPMGPQTCWKSCATPPCRS